MVNNQLESLIRQEIAAYETLRRETAYQPPIWILPPFSCAFLKKLAALAEPELRAFEFGSGRSTLAMRSVCAGVTSVEDSAEWLEKTEQLEGQIPKRSSDLAAVVPLSTCRLGLVPFRSFDIEARPELLQRLEGAGLVLVDSPPNPATREHALFLALRHVRPGAMVVLDDLDVRATKRFATRLARDNQESFDFYHLPVDHELGLFRRKTAGKPSYRPSLREALGAWQRR